MSKQDTDKVLHSVTNIFDPVVYIQAHYNGVENYPCPQDTEIVDWTSEKIYRMFTEGSNKSNITGKYRGKSILGVGVGPVIKDVITASEWFDEIYLTDISKDNVAFLRKWMAGDAVARKAMKYQIEEFIAKEGKTLGISWEAKNEQVRNKVQDAVVFDMNQPEMLKGTALDGLHHDFVIACLTVCCTSSTFDGYVTVLKNISKLIKSGGHLAVLDVMDQTTYTVGDKTFDLLCTTPETIKSAFRQIGFDVEHFETHKLGDYPKTVRSDCKTVYFVIGRKM